MAETVKMYTIKKDSEVIILDESGEMIGSEVFERDATFNETWFVKEEVCSNPECSCPREPIVLFRHKNVPYIQTEKSNVVVSVDVTF
jgi:hypothetical protein